MVSLHKHFTSTFVTLEISLFKREEEEAKKRELEKASEEERVRKEQEVLRATQHQNDTTSYDIEMTKVPPSAPPLIGDYPAPPASRQEAFVSDQATVGDNQRQHSAPSSTGDAVGPPSFSSLYSVPVTR